MCLKKAGWELPTRRKRIRGGTGKGVTVEQMNAENNGTPG